LELQRVLAGIETGVAPFPLLTVSGPAPASSSRLLKNASVSRFVPLQRANRTESKTERIQAKMSFSAAC